MYSNDPRDSCHCMAWCPTAPAERWWCTNPIIVHLKENEVDDHHWNKWLSGMYGCWRHTAEVPGLLFCFFFSSLEPPSCTSAACQRCFRCTLTCMRARLSYQRTLVTYRPLHFNFDFCSRQAAPDLTYFHFLFIYFHICILESRPASDAWAGVGAQAGTALRRSSCLHVSQ